MTELSKSYPVKRVAECLDVSRSGYYLVTGQGPRAESDAELLEHIRRIHTEHRERYGSPRMYLELRRQGIVCSENRVARLMREAGIPLVPASVSEMTAERLRKVPATAPPGPPSPWRP